MKSILDEVWSAIKKSFAGQEQDPKVKLVLGHFKLLVLLAICSFVHSGISVLKVPQWLEALSTVLMVALVVSLVWVFYEEEVPHRGMRSLLMVFIAVGTWTVITSSSRGGMIADFQRIQIFAGSAIEWVRHIADKLVA